MGSRMGNLLNTDEYPFLSHFLDMGGLKYHYLDEEPPDGVTDGDRGPLLMLHGNPTWSFYYRHLILGLRDQWRCVVPDHIGCGLSDKPQRYDYCLERHIENVERLVEARGLDNITLVVHDWGGAIGMGFAVRHPEKIRRFVVFNTSAFLSSHIPFRIALCRVPLFGALAVRGLNAFARAAIFMACAHRKRMTHSVRMGYLAPYDSWANRVAVLRFVQDIPMGPKDRSYALMKSIDEGSARFRNHPMLVCWGKKDFCFNDTFLALWRERFPQAGFHEFADAGHYVVEDAHERILPLMRGFLDGGSRK
jgi:cis-3-alkyl-4-acyloxetan-2-one decarboxylase